MSEKASHNSNNLLAQALVWAETTDVALATVINTWGSAPRPVGSIMIIKNNDQFEGSVSGGCIEGAVIHSGREVISSGVSQCLEFGVSNEDAISVGLACGGTIRVLVERLDAKKCAQIKQILESLQENTPAIWLKDINGSSAAEVILPSDENITAEHKKNLNDDHSLCVLKNDTEIFLHIFNTPLKLVIIGAVHIAQTLSPIAKLSGFEVVVIDPRGAFADAERMQGTNVIEGWPDEVLTKNMPDNRTGIVTLTHDPKLDDAALKVALKSEAFYIGCLGSKKTHAKRCDRLAEMGFTDKQLNRIHGPVGLDIGAKSPAEIAVSIVSQIIATYRDAK